MNRIGVLVLVFVVLVFAVGVLVLTPPLSPALGTRCTVGIVGTAASTTVQGWGARQACQELLARPQAYELTQPPAQPVICEYSVSGLRFIVRDEDNPRPVGNAICSSLAQGSGATWPNPEAIPAAASAEGVIPSPGRPSMDALLASLPATAKELVGQQWRIWGHEFVLVGYRVPSEVASPGVGAAGGVSTLDREYDQIFLWEEGWRRVLDTYQWAWSHFGEQTIGPLPGGLPQPETALVWAKFYHVTVERMKQDFLVLQACYTLGPSGAQQCFPAVAVLRWSGRDVDTLWSRDLGVRGGIVSVASNETSFEIIADGYLPGDPLCCPSGWEHFILTVDPDGSVRQTGWCVSRRYSGCAGPPSAPGPNTATPTPVPVLPTATPTAPPPPTATPVPLPPEPTGGLPSAIAIVQREGYAVLGTGSYNTRYQLRVLIGTATAPGGSVNQKAFFFLGDRYVGTDTADPSAGISVEWQEDLTLALRYSSNDNNPACPRGEAAVVRYRWNGSQVLPLDPIPPDECRRGIS